MSEPIPPDELAAVETEYGNPDGGLPWQGDERVTRLVEAYRAQQAESEIIYQEYPGTHGTFGKNQEKKDDFARFILEKSGMVGPSGVFGDKKEKTE